MPPRFYKMIVLALVVTLLATTTLAVSYNDAIGNRPQLSDEKVLEYEWQVCDLQVDLGYPACFVNGEHILVDELSNTERNTP